MLKRRSYFLGNLLCCYLLVTLPISTYADPIFRINDGTEQTISKFGSCRKITNASGKDMMVAASTSTEWLSFVNNAAMAGVTKSSCAPCDGASLGDLDSSGAVCAGTFRGIKYMITPSGCTDLSNPVCAGGPDALTKTWRGTTGSNVDILDAYNLTGDATAATQPGLAATSIIVADASVSSNSAADYCDAMTFGGFSDWYLPNKSELVYLFCNSNRSGSRTAGYPPEQTNCAGDFNGPTTAFSNFATGYYQTSTENSTTSVWQQYFTDGQQLMAVKNIARYVRCMRQYDPNAIFFNPVRTTATTGVTNTVTISGLLSPPMTIHFGAIDIALYTYEYRKNGGAYVPLNGNTTFTVTNGDTLDFRFTWNYCGGTYQFITLRKNDASGGVLDHFQINLGTGICPF